MDVGPWLMYFIVLITQFWVLALAAANHGRRLVPTVLAEVGAVT